MYYLSTYEADLANGKILRQDGTPFSTYSQYVAPLRRLVLAYYGDESGDMISMIRDYAGLCIAMEKATPSEKARVQLGKAIRSLLLHHVEDAVSSHLSGVECLRYWKTT